jgi:hypothetical protein
MEEEPMSGLGFTRSDICSISSIASPGRIAGAARGVLRDDGNLLAHDDRHELLASSIDRAIGLSTAAAVLAVAAVAAYVSYWHAYAVVRAHGPLATRSRHHGQTDGEHGPRLVARSRRGGGRGLASGQSRGLV